jgi:hypothetical protein
MGECLAKSLHSKTSDERVITAAKKGTIVVHLIEEPGPLDIRAEFRLAVLYSDVDCGENENEQLVPAKPVPRKLDPGELERIPPVPIIEDAISSAEGEG